VRHRGGEDDVSDRTAWRFVVLCASVVGAIVLVSLLYLSSVHSYPGSSDGASVILEGKALLGNFTLTHWALSLDSFWLVDAPFYAIAVLVGGVHPQLLHLVPAIIAVGVIGCGAWIAQRDLGRWAGIFATGTVVVLLGLPTHAFAQFFLIGPFHVATTLWCLVAFVALRKARFGWGWLLAVCFLAAGVLGDLLTVVLGVAPIGLAGITAALRVRRWRAAVPALSAALGSLVLAEAVRRIAWLIGTYTIGPANPRADFHQMVINIVHVITWGAALEGVGSRPFGSPGVPPVLGVAHAVGLILVVLAVVGGLIAIVTDLVISIMNGDEASVSGETADSSRWEVVWFEDVLVFGFFGGCATFVWFTFASVAPFGRYLTAAVVFGSILGARLAGRIAKRAKDGWLKVALVGVAALVAVGYVTTFVNTLTTAPPAQPAVNLAAYLGQHHLTRGIGDFWSASIVTVESSDAVVVRPVVTLDGSQHIVRYTRLSSSAWYGGGFEFLVYNVVSPWAGVDAQSARASFGRPQHVAAVGPYNVLTWAHDLTLRSDGTYAPQPWAHR
jgi:hypothetical protein